MCNAVHAAATHSSPPPGFGESQEVLAEWEYQSVFIGHACSLIERHVSDSKYVMHRERRLER